MIKNYLLITFRSLMKNKLFILINMFGMGIAIACCVVAYVNWEYARNWDGTQTNADRIYRVQFYRDFQGKHDRYGTAPMPLGNIIKQNFHDVSRVVRYQSSYCDMRIGEEIFGTDMVFVDSAFFELFTYELKYGAATDFHDKSKVFVSDEVARKYFNREDVVGRSLTQIVLGKDGIRRPKEFIIGGVFKQQPFNSSFRFDVVTLFDNFRDIHPDTDQGEANWKLWNTLFLEIKDPTRLAAVTRQLQAYVEPQNKAREDFKVTSYFLENFKGMMERNRATPRVNSDYLRGGIPPEAVTVPAIMAGLLLLLACFNFINTSISISSRRLKEIGLRKVMGGVRSQLILQFLGENLLLCILGLVTGLLIAEWMVPAYDSLWSWLELSLRYSENTGFLLFLSALLVFTALIAGGYPSFYITSFEPVSILKGTSRFGGTNWFTRILLGGQLVISLLSIVVGIAFYRNGEYQKNYDLGYTTHGVISTWVNNEGAFNTYRDALAPNKDIEVIAGTKSHLGNWSFYNDPIKFESLIKEVDILDVGDHYVDVMEMKIVAGRNFRRDSRTDQKESVLVSEELVRQFGWKDNPVGKRLVWMDTVPLFVVGVIRNVYSRALWMPVQPLMVRYVEPARYQQLVVRTNPAKMAEINAFMEKKWKEVFPNTQYNGEMIENQLQESRDINKNVVIMFGFLGAFAALLSGIGMYTLVSLNIVKKMKEIGVRKVLGASHLNLARVINLEFGVILALATVAGCALGFFGADWLMDSIWEYYEKLGLITLILSSGTLIGVAVLAVGYKTITTASLNPVKTLRDE